MSEFQVLTNVDLIKRKTRRDVNKFDRVLRISINKTKAKCVTTAKKSIKEQANKNARKKLDNKLLNRKLKHNNASFSNLNASIRMRKVRRYADQYQHSIDSTGVTFNLPTGNYRKDGAFKAKAGGRNRIFIRKSRQRRGNEPLRRIKSGPNAGKTYRPHLPIKRVVATVVNARNLNSTTIEAIDKRAVKEWPIELDRALNFVFKGRQ